MPRNKNTPSMKPENPEGPQPNDPDFWLADAWRIADHFQQTGGRGRPPLLSDHALIARLLARIAGGATPSGAAQMEGIAPANFSNWQDRGIGPNAETGYIELLNVLNKAEGYFKNWHERNISHYAQYDWVPSAWLLERRYPEYRKQTAIDMTHTRLDGPKRAEVKEIPFSTQDAYRLYLMSQGGPGDPNDDPPIEGDYKEVEGEGPQSP